MEYLRPGTLVIEVEPGTVHVGSTPHNCVIMSRLTPGEVEWITSLSTPTPRKRGRPRAHHTLPDRQREILAMLEAADLLGVREAVLAPLSIRIVGLDAVGARVATLLAEAGVGALELRDRKAVSASVEAAFSERAVGGVRQTALRQQIRRRRRNLRIGALSSPDLVIVSSARVWDHGTLGRLLSRDVPHLPIVQDEGSVTVGPLVVPGVSACALCVDMHVRDTFPTWPAVSLALASAPPPVVPDHLCMAAAGLAVTMIEAIASGRTMVDSPAVTDSTFPTQSWSVSAAGVETKVWTPHRQCMCHHSAALSAPHLSSQIEDKEDEGRSAA